MIGDDLTKFNIAQDAFRTAEYGALASLLPAGCTASVFTMGASVPARVKAQIAGNAAYVLNLQVHPHACRVLPETRNGYGGVGGVLSDEYALLDKELSLFLAAVVPELQYYP